MSVREKSYTIKALEKADEGGAHFEGYLSTYGNTDRDSDVFVKGAFAKSIAKKSTVPLCYNHRRDAVIGKLELTDDDKGVFAKGFLNLADPQAANVYELLKMGALDSMSVGFAVKDYEPVDIKRPFGGWNIKEGEIYEGSIVTVPANEEARVTDVKEFSEVITAAAKKAVAEEHTRQSLLKQIEGIR